MLRVRRDKLPLLVAAVGAVLPTLGFAQTSNWTFNGGGGNWTQSWNQNTNWSPNTAFPNAATSNAIFAPGILAAGAGGSGTVQILTAVTVNTIRVQPTGTNSNAYNFTGAGTLNVVGNGTIEVSPGGTGGNQAATFANSIQTPNNSTTTKIGTGIAVFTGNNNFGSGSLSTFSVDQGTAVFSGANAANGLFIIGTNNDGVIELNNATINAFGGLGSTTPVADGMIHATGNSTWNGTIFVTRTAGSMGANTGVTLTVNGSIVDGENSAINGFSKVGGDGTVTVTNLVLNGPLSVQAGRLKVAAGASPTSAAGASSTSSLSVSGTGLLDLTNNKLIVNYGTNSSPASAIRAMLISGRGGGTWNGTTGITSSTATGNFTLAYGDGADIPAIGAGKVEVAYTLIGDINLDGVVSGADFSRLVANIGQSIPKWTSGDLNYDGVISGADFSALVSRLGLSSGGSLPAVALTSLEIEQVNAEAALLGVPGITVPEPATMSLVGLGVMGLLSRRNRRR